MYEEMVKTVKTLLCAVILLSMFKIYENGGYSNPITIAVLIIMFSLWILFRIELNEEVSEITEEGDNKQVHTNSEHQSEQSSNCTTPRGRPTPRPVASLSDKIEKNEKRCSKFRALVARSRSRSPDQYFRR
jgi:hypothetical protein